MKAPVFERNKLSRLIRVQGLPYTFKRHKLNDFKEPMEEVSATTVRGVFHQTTQYVSVVGADASSVQNKFSPFILALYPEAKGIKQGDFVQINGVKYAVNGLNNIGNWNIAVDISLEAVV